ncbi:MAG: hypothetical protein ABJH45_26635 [Paracoccaceae bacterium]
MHRLNRVEKWAQVLEWVTAISLIVIPVLVVVGLFQTPITPAALDTALENHVVPSSTTPLQLYLAIGIMLIPLIILMFTLNFMRELFGNYRKSEILTEHCAFLIQRIGQGFLLVAVVRLLMSPMLSGLLSFSNPPGERSISFNLNGEMYFFAVSGGLILMIGWAMREASEVASENKAFV